MNWTELLRSEIEEVYAATEGLLDRVDDDSLSWKPASGENWMTVGQLLKHIPEACGMCIRGFATGDWGLPEGVSLDDLNPEEMMVTAEQMPAAESVAKTKAELAADKEVALATIAEVGEERLANEECTAPWDPRPLALGQRMLGMVSHLAHHKSQLFYYLKLMGKPVGTHDLYGMSLEG